MNRILIAAALVLALWPARAAHALCGDVTGDAQLSASDALAVLRSSVGQQVDLVCACEGPSDVRMYNPFECPEGSSVSETRFNGYTFEADYDELSPYQTVEREEISSIEIDLCDETYFFDGPVLLPPGRNLTFFMLLLDPELYDFPGVEVPAQFAIYDDGPVGEDMTAGAPGSGRLVQRLYGGVR